MREKEAIENERKALARHGDKQTKAVERLVESEKNLLAQVVSTFQEYHLPDLTHSKQTLLEKELELHRAKDVTSTNRITGLVSQVEEMRGRLEAAVTSNGEVRIYGCPK
jgi:hypothetical protein